MYVVHLSYHSSKRAQFVLFITVCHFLLLKAGILHFESCWAALRDPDSTVVGFSISELLRWFLLLPIILNGNIS